jgi:hypothetical protein
MTIAAATGGLNRAGMTAWQNGQLESAAFT